MADITVQGGDTLWGIAQSQGFTSNAEINKYKNSIYASNIKVIGDNPNLILPGQVLTLPDKNSVFGKENAPVSDPIAETPAPIAETPAPTDKPAEDNLGKKFDGWIESCADSLTGEKDENNEPTYKHDVSPFNMARTPEFIAAVKAEDYDKANNVYRENADALAGSIVDNADTDGDGMLSVKEFIKKEEDDLKKKISGSEDVSELAFDDDSKKEFNRLFVRQFVMMNLDVPKNVKPEDVKVEDLRIDKREYAAFLMAMDGSNPQEIANGEITRDENLAVTKIIESGDEKAMRKFMKVERDSYKKLYDPKTGK